MIGQRALRARYHGSALATRTRIARARLAGTGNASRSTAGRVMLALTVRHWRHGWSESGQPVRAVRCARPVWRTCRHGRGVSACILPAATPPPPAAPSSPRHAAAHAADRASGPRWRRLRGADEVTGGSRLGGDSGMKDGGGLSERQDAEVVPVRHDASS